MTHEIAAAAITGVCGILAGSAPSVIKSILDGRTRYPSTRREAIPGTWSGDGKDTYVEEHREFFEFHLTLTFEVGGKMVHGVGDLEYQFQKISMECEGGFLTDDYMQFIYRSRDRTRKQMGVIVFRLEESGTVLSGHYAGLSPTRGVFVSGQVTLPKIASKT